MAEARSRSRRFHGFQACSADPNSPVYLDALGGLPIEALSPDTSDFQVTEQFRVWPVSDPSQAVIFSDQFALTGIEQSVTVPASDLTDGLTYAWDAQTVTAIRRRVHAWRSGDGEPDPAERFRFPGADRGQLGPGV